MSAPLARILRAVLLPAAALVLAGLATAGCASLPGPARGELVVDGPKAHGSAREEWAPHKGVHEWWYLTAVVAAEDSGAKDSRARDTTSLLPSGGEVYLLQFTIFRLNVEPGGLYMLHLACSEYAGQRHLFEQRISFDPSEAGADGYAVRFGRSSIELSAGEMRVRGEGRELSMELVARISEGPLWHGRDGVISMGHPGTPGEDSFYYSFVRMATTGTLSLRDGDGSLVTLRVSGSSWFDRQWGRFDERGWDWLSLRFFDGDRIMLFAFPKTGHREATYARADGTVSWPEDYDYTVERWVEQGGKRYGLGWRLDLPVKDGRYRVVPLQTEDFNPNPANDYWEGLCRLLDSDGRLVGWCVVETTAPAYAP